MTPAALALPTAATAPLVSMDTVTHIGTLNAGDKGIRGDSYEGTGLSFSIHPEEWEQIARLGGQPWWETDLSGEPLLDGHAFLDQHAEALAAWGEAEGWLARGQMFEARWFDDELEQEVALRVPTREEALAEVEDRVDDPETAVTLVDPCWLATPKLDVAMGRTPREQPEGDAQVLQDVATVWARAQGLTGVWWEDELDEWAYSAPRGVVFEDHVPRLAFAKVRDVQVRRGPRP